MDITDRIRKLVEEGAGRTKLMRMFPEVSEWQIRKIIAEVKGANAAPEKPQVKFVEKGDTAELTSTKSNRIRSLDDLLAACQVDLTQWEIDRYRVNKWEVGSAHPETGVPLVEDLWQVDASFKRKKLTDIEAFKRDLLEDLRANAPEFPNVAPQVVQDSERHMLEVCLFDLHFGKYTSAEVTGNTYNLDTAEALFHWALDDLIRKTSGYPVDKIVLPITEILHVDSFANTTTRGTPQSMDQDWYAALRAARRVLVQAIEKLMQIAPVEVVIVPGNHARHTEIALGEILDAYFSRTDRVQIHGGPMLRKYVRYGVNLIGFTHGDGEKMDALPLIMATDRPADWAECEFREVHIGHWHKKKERKFTPVDEFNGVRVRVLPSLSATDAWHYQNGYTSPRRSAEAYIWNYTTGYAGHVAVNVMLNNTAE